MKPFGAAGYGPTNSSAGKTINICGVPRAADRTTRAITNY